MDFFGRASKCTDLGYRAAAERIGCEKAVLRAVISVEAAASGFDGKGRPKALFEPHVFYRLLSGEKRRAAINAGLAYQKWGTRPYPKDSYPRIISACLIDEECALQATSWGLAQILGQNHKAAGYPNAADMVVAFCEGEDEQLAAMARFIVASKLDAALKRKDWAAFAKGYNGPGYATHSYHRKLAKAYAYFCGMEPGPLPESLTPEAKNRDQSNRVAKAAKRSAAVALSTGLAAPVAVSVAGTVQLDPFVSTAIAIALGLLAGAALIAAWRAFHRAGSFK